MIVVPVPVVTAVSSDSGDSCENGDSDSGAGSV